jgi:hypothetical protein
VGPTMGILWGATWWDPHCETTLGGNPGAPLGGLTVWNPPCGLPFWDHTLVSPLQRPNLLHTPLGTTLGGRNLGASLGDQIWGTSLRATLLVPPSGTPLWRTPLWESYWGSYLGEPTFWTKLWVSLLGGPFWGTPLEVPSCLTHLGFQPCGTPLADPPWGTPLRTRLGGSHLLDPNFEPIWETTLRANFRDHTWWTPIVDPLVGVLLATPKEGPRFGIPLGGSLSVTPLLGHPLGDNQFGTTHNDHPWGNPIGGPPWFNPLGGTQSWNRLVGPPLEYASWGTPLGNTTWGMTFVGPSLRNHP